MHPHLKAALPTLSAAEASCPNRAVVRAEAIFPKLGCAGLGSVSGPAAAGRAEGEVVATSDPNLPQMLQCPG